MQTRLLATLAGGLLGVVLASPINASLGLTPILAVIGCSLSGMAIGYAVSILFDVFAAPSKEPVDSSK
jgi:hypothetical protein